MGFNLYFLVIWDFMESGMKDTVNLHLHAITILKKKKKKKNLEQNKVYVSHARAQRKHGCLEEAGLLDRVSPGVFSPVPHHF